MPVTIQEEDENAKEFLKHHKVGVLASVDPDGNPHGAAIYFTVDSHQNISFLTKSRTKKSDNLRHNKHAMLVVYEEESQTTVQVTGVVSEITDNIELNQVFTQIVKASLETSGTGVPPISRLREGDYVAYKLKPKQIRMAVFTHPKFGDYKDIFRTTVPQD